MKPQLDPFGNEAPNTVEIRLPRLSDEAAVQIHDFIQHVLEQFERLYGDQVHRFHQDYSRDNLVQTEFNLNLDDPPF